MSTDDKKPKKSFASMLASASAASKSMIKKK